MADAMGVDGDGYGRRQRRYQAHHANTIVTRTLVTFPTNHKKVTDLHTLKIIVQLLVLILIWDLVWEVASMANRVFALRSRWQPDQRRSSEGRML